MKKIIFFVLLLLMANKAYAATLYGCTSGGTFSGNIWVTSTGAQAACTGGAGPGTTNALVMNAATGNITIGGAAAAASLDQTNYAGTLAFGTQTFTISGTAKIGSAMTSTSGTLSVAGGVTLLSTVTGSFPTLTIAGASTLTSGGFTWPGSLKLSVAGNVVLSGNWINTGLVTYTAATNLNVTTAETLTTNGGLTMTSASGTTPTATIIIGGSGGVWSGSTALSNNLTFNCTTATISGTVAYKLGTMLYTAGTITTTSSTLNIVVGGGSTTTLNTNGITWNDINSTFNNAIVALGSNLTCTGTLILQLSQTFSGAFDISCGTLYYLSSSSSSTFTLVAGRTLTITTGLRLASDITLTNPLTITSSSSTNFIYQGNLASCRVAGVVFTNINASGSAQGIDNWYGGTLTGTTNITNRTNADFATSAQAGSINTGTTISGVAGTLTLPAASDVWHTASAYGVGGSGSTPSKVASSITNCSAGNVKSGVTIDDVTGTYTGGGSSNDVFGVI
jgi:hypothetical protein